MGDTLAAEINNHKATMPTRASAFGKPQSRKAALKAAFYGPAGSGKTFTALLLAEGLARHTGKRVAFIDTEFGTNFYSQSVAARKVHPDAFAFDVMYSKSITEVLNAVRSLDPAVHGVLVIDSISHIWDAAIAAYNGKKTKYGSIPMHAWSSIKRPYKELMHLLLSSPIHVLLCGRQGNDFVEDEGSGELKSLGFKMRCENETAYEADVLVRLEAHKASKKALAVPTAIVEKDRSGILAGQSIPWPTFDNIARPLLGLLGNTHVAAPSEEETALRDAEALDRIEAERVQRSAEQSSVFIRLLQQASTIADLHKNAEGLTPAIKATFTADDLQRTRDAYAKRLAALKHQPTTTR